MHNKLILEEVYKNQKIKWSTVLCAYEEWIIVKWQQRKPEALKCGSEEKKICKKS